MDSPLLMGEALLAIAVLAGTYEIRDWLRGRRAKRIVRRASEDYRRATTRAR